MIQKVFGVRDGKALAFLQPFYSVSSGSAIRAFDDTVNATDGNQIAKHPEDYVLYEIAEFDDCTGEFKCCTPLKLLGSGVDFVKRSVKPTMGSVPDVKANDLLKEVITNGS